jgi:hypothetical protein
MLMFTKNENKNDKKESHPSLQNPSPHDFCKKQSVTASPII